MSYSRKDILDYLAANKENFRRDFRIIKLGIFGSYSRDAQTPGSDIDLIIEFEEGTGELYGKKYELRRRISEHFNMNVDICREKAIKKMFKDQIMGEAIFV